MRELPDETGTCARRAHTREGEADPVGNDHHRRDRPFSTMIAMAGTEHLVDQNTRPTPDGPTSSPSG